MPDTAAEKPRVRVRAGRSHVLGSACSGRAPLRTGAAEQEKIRQAAFKAGRKEGRRLERDRIVAILTAGAELGQHQQALAIVLTMNVSAADARFALECSHKAGTGSAWAPDPYERAIAAAEQRRAAGGAGSLEDRMARVRPPRP